MAQSLAASAAPWRAGIVFLTIGCGSAWREQPQNSWEAPAGPLRYSVDFTTNQHGRPESTCGRPVCQRLLSKIARAVRTIDFAVYGIRSQKHVIDALVAAERRGVRVRGVVDTEDAGCTAFAYPDTAALIDALSPGSVVCDTGSAYGAIMHNKFFVFDQESVWTGSTNLSDTELGGEYSTDVAALIESRALAEIYQGEFEEMYSGLFHEAKSDNSTHVLDEQRFTDGTELRSYFSPTDAATKNAILPLIDAATQTLDVAMFFFTSNEVADALLSARARGVKVRVILDAEGASSEYSQDARLCAAGIALKIENWGGKSHAKWAVADAASAPFAAVAFGSMNFTRAGENRNDENTLYLKNAELSALFAAEFEREWKDLAGVPECRKISAEGSESSRCAPADDCTESCASGACCDDLDNDHDGKIDLEEEACACSDAVDNDSDGYVDSDDYDCVRPAGAR